MSSTNDPTDTPPDSEPIKDTFQLLKEFYAGDLDDDPSLDDDGDDTVSAGLNVSLIQTRLNLCVPGDDEASSKATDILTATKEILECLRNEFPSIRIIPWKVVHLADDTPKRHLLPTDPKEAEAFIFNYTRYLLKSQVTSASKSFMIPLLHPRILITSLPRIFLNPDATFYRLLNQMRSSPR